jgi:hypothetical protein
LGHHLCAILLKNGSKLIHSSRMQSLVGM